MNIQTYNSAIAKNTKRWLRLACFICVANLAVAVAWAQDFTAPETALAEKIVALTGPGAINLSVTNRSTLRTQTVDEIRRGLLTELASRGARFVSPEQAAAVVEVYLSENQQEYLWSARIQQGVNAPAIVMVSLPRPAGPPLGSEKAQLRIIKTLLWSQQKPILDAGTIDANPPHLVVLSPDSIALYRPQGDHPQLEQILPITHRRPWPRDIRGRLLLGKEQLLQAYLPGVTCQSGVSTPLALNCRESDDPWPVGTDQFSLNAFFSPTRNFFTGALSPSVGKQNLAPFYTVAAVLRERYTLWLTAGVDGQLHLVDGMADQTIGKLRWGSDIAALRSACGSGWQVVATSTSENDDSIRAFEIVDRSPVPVSEPLAFNGSITALWSDPGGSRAVAVSRSKTTGFYEAYRISIACDGR
ncbi:MAG: hypothetical protein DMG91_02165 [Acidobacteria bacterium]|nr:MAG: hypothetical protein DMG91_02165 [Acidobacteriota bacterium]